jgi:hypothetical protein
VSGELDVDAMIQRFQARAKAVRQRAMPPVEGVERQRFIDQARIDFLDYAMIGDAVASLEDGILTLRIDLRPRDDGPGAGSYGLLLGGALAAGASAAARPPSTGR